MLVLLAHLPAILFADVQNQAATWIAVASTLVTTLGLIAGSYFAWLSSRDRNRIGTLEEKVADCEKRHEQCEESHAETRTELTNTKSELKARDARDKAELQAQINDLKQQVNGGGK